MSIKTFNRPEGDRILFFLILSILIHMGAALGFASLGWLAQPARHMAGDFGPIAVDVVRLPERKTAPELEGPRRIVKLPPVETQRLSKENKPAAHLSDRTQSVEEETYPEPGRAASPPPQPMQAQQQPQAKTDGGGKGATGAERARAAAEQAPPSDGAPGEETYAALRGKGAKDGPGAGQGATGREKNPGETIIVPPRPNLFLTEDRIAELTRRYESEPQKGERGKVLQLNTTESRYAEYVNDSLVPPIEFRMGRGLAARKGWLGNLLIDFTVKKDGSLGAIVLVRSSGNPALDDDTVTSLKLASPFPPLPGKFEMEEITIRGIFVYY